MDLKKIEDVIRPVTEREGFKLYDVEFLGRTLRVCIEKADGQVSLQDCVGISRILNPILDVENLVTGGRYDLEVSSPGLDRRLRRPEHFQGAIGERIHVTTDLPLKTWNTSDPQDGFFETRRNVTGQLTSFDGKEIKLLGEGHEILIPLENVTKAYVDFEVTKTPKKGKRV